jgi:CRISPR/Cas system-associated exonuclease Cas4 (RecB family)
MSEQVFEISATQLGELSQRWTCPRCFWLRSKLKGQLPYQQFPAVFSQIDRFSKDLIKQSFDRGELPEWIKVHGDFREALPVPGHQKFKAFDKDSGFLLGGVPDALWVTGARELVIVDWKTSRVSEGELKKWESYVTQLNAYAWIAERQKNVELPPVSRLALLYTEPLSLNEAEEGVDRFNGFVLPFRTVWKEVELQPGRVEKLLLKAQNILSSETPPKSMRNCFECEKVDKMTQLL